MKKVTEWILVIAFLGVCGQAAQSTAEEQTADIWKAAASGNIEAIKQHLEAGTDVDAKEPPGGSTPLLVAAIFGRAEAAKLLIEKGANINARSNDGATVLHAAAFFCHTEMVKLLLGKGVVVNAKNIRGETPLDSVAGEWSQELESIYKWIAERLQLQLDLERIKATRPKVAALLRKAEGKAGDRLKEVAAEVRNTGFRGSYFVNGEIHVNTYGTPEGKPLTSGHQDFKPSWSKTGDMLVFFRRLKDDPVVTNWITAICVINVDGTGFHQLTNGTHTDFNQTWTRDGSNTPIWNRKNPETGSFYVIKSKVGAKPGQEVALTDKLFHTWAYTCLKDGRILVQSAHPKQGHGYYLIKPNVGGEPKFERIDCKLAKTGLLDRVSISPSGNSRLFSPRTTELRNACLAKAHELQMGIVAMKVLGAGMLGGFGKKELERLPGAAIRYVFQDDRIQILTIGMRYPAEIDDNIKTLAGDTTYTNEDRALLAGVSAAVLSDANVKKMSVE